MPAEAPKKEKATFPEKHKRAPTKKTVALPVVLMAAVELQSESCIVEKWAGEAVIRRKDNFLLASELRASFDAWCQNNNLTPVNATTFGRRMTNLNFKRKKVGGSMRYEGVALRGAWPELTLIDGARA
jgi:hypothetical protein